MAPVIVVTGTRGIPDVQGGVETHVENLYPLIAKAGFDVRICCRSCYFPEDRRPVEYKGCKLLYIDTPKRKSFEAIVHTWRSVLYARRIRADLVHIHAVGPGLMVPLAKLLGLKVLFTHHGPDYERAKWGKFAKFMLRAGEAMGVRYSDAVIAISQGIKDLLSTKYGRNTVHVIPNGVRIPVLSENKSSYIESIDLAPHRYFLSVARFVEEKGLHDLVEAFRRADLPGWKLVLAGDADHETPYSRELKRQATAIPGVVLTGFIKGEQLEQIYRYAGLFILPSYHEGLPIALLEAMSYGLPVLVSAIGPHLEMGLGTNDYFKPKDLAKLSERLVDFSRTPRDAVDYRKVLATVYSWDRIAEQMVRVIGDMLSLAC